MPARPQKHCCHRNRRLAINPFHAPPRPGQAQRQGAQVPEWRAEDGATNPLPQSPVISDQPEETITLIPYAAAKLRITAFPVSQSRG